MGYALTSKSQVTVPKAIRQQLGVDAGKEIDYRTLPDGSVVMFAVKVKASTKGTFSKWRGVGVQKRSTDEILSETRGPSMRRRA